MIVSGFNIETIEFKMHDVIDIATNKRFWASKVVIIWISAIENGSIFGLSEGTGCIWMIVWSIELSSDGENYAA